MNIAIVLFFTVSNALLWFVVTFLIKKQMMHEASILALIATIGNDEQANKLQKFFRTGKLD